MHSSSFVPARDPPTPLAPDHHNRAVATAGSPNQQSIRKALRPHPQLRRCTEQPDVRAADRILPNQTTIRAGTQTPPAIPRAISKEIRAAAAGPFSSTEATETAAAPIAPSAPRLL